jgi:TolB protein
MTKTLRLLAALLAMLTAVPAMAQGFVINVGPGSKDFPLGLPKTVSPDGSAAADELWAVVNRDLDMTGYFRIIDPAAYIDEGTGVEPGSFQLKDWRVIAASGLAKTRVQQKDGMLLADVYIYDVNSGEKISAKRYSGKPGDTRYLGHKIADEVLRALTGETGFFGSRLLTVGSGRGGNKEIFLMDIDGHGVAAVTRNGAINLSPAWSPGGGDIAWTSFKRGNPDIYVKSLRAGRTRVLSNAPGVNTGAAYSPDGSKVAVTRSENGDSDIYILDATSGSVVKRITKGGGIDVGPSWSPDGARLAFASERSGGSQIFVADVATGQATRVSRQGSFNTDPVFSPDGSKLAYVGRDPSFDVFVLDLENGRSVRITEHMGDNEDPSFSPDGKYLIFSSTRGGKSQIWLSTSDGRHQVPVTDSGGWTQPVWGPQR